MKIKTVSPNWQIKLALFFNVWVFSTFACTLSTFIMQAVSFFHETPTTAGTLESYQNIAMVIFTFVAFSYILKVGYKKALMTVIGLMTVICLIMPLVPEYWIIKLYLVGVGIVLVGMKVGVYATVSLCTQNESKQAQFLSLLEATWMLASMVGMWILGYCINKLGANWLYSMWIFAVIGIVGLVMWSFTNLDESALQKEQQQPIKQQLKDIFEIAKNRLVIAVIIMLFIANLIEMGLSAWLPGFYQNALAVSPSLSVYIASMALFATFAGRLVVVVLLRYMTWEKVLLVFYAIGLLFLCVILFTLKQNSAAINEISQVPKLALLLPLVGFFLAPNTPLLNSSILARTSKEKQALLMTVLSIVFAVASSLGARLIGQLIEHLGGIVGFKIATLIPLLLLLILILPYAKFLKSSKVD